jgi:hypothetical protein
MATKNPQQQPQAQEPPTVPPVTPVRQTDEPQDDGQPAGAGHKPSGHKKKPQVPAWLRSWRNWQKSIAVSEVILAAAIAWFAWVQADVSEGQLSAMKTQTDQTEKTLELMRQEQRPLVLVDDVKFTNLEFGSVPKATITIRNYGPTPAFIYRRDRKLFFESPEGMIPGMSRIEGLIGTAAIDAFFRPDSLRNDGLMPGDGPHEALPPNQQRELIVDGGRPLEKADMEAMRLGTGAVFLMGRIVYTGTPRHPSETDYCYFGTPEWVKQFPKGNNSW